jgi:DMSO/TMAO reductase YedYZ molybdopterin-dependent catalytic subunit
LVGLLVAGAAVAAGEVVAAFLRPAASPIVVVGNRLIDLTPESVRRWAIRQFGGSDKLILLTGIYLAIALLAVGVGVVAMRRRWLGLLGLAAFGAVGVYCALTTAAHRPSDAVPAIVAAAVGAAVLWHLTREARESLSGPGPDRRQFLVVAATTAAVALVAGVGGRVLQQRRSSVSGARAAVVFPPPASPAPQLAAGTDLGKGGVPFLTPVAGFYRVDTALAVPQLDPTGWRLKIHGMVEHELTLTYQDLLARPLIERYITLACVSNEVGGNLISNGRFLGVRLADILREAGVDPRCDQLLATSSDGMTIGSPTKVVMDGRDAMLAVGLDGAPLPVVHGFPVRMVVPGLYGYVSACKWIVDLEATTFDAVSAYWVINGWVPQAPVLLASRIDRPTRSQTVRVGENVTVAGVAWDQHVGVSWVHVQVDGGSWQDARLAPVPSIDTWRQWVYIWTVVGAGKHTLRVRATDARGRNQDETARDPFPGAATGLHSITVEAT